MQKRGEGFCQPAREADEHLSVLKGKKDCTGAGRGRAVMQPDKTPQGMFLGGPAKRGKDNFRTGTTAVCRGGVLLLGRQ